MTPQSTPLKYEERTVSWEKGHEIYWQPETLYGLLFRVREVEGTSKARNSAQENEGTHKPATIPTITPHVGGQRATQGSSTRYPPDDNQLRHHHLENVQQDPPTLTRDGIDHHSDTPNDATKNCEERSVAQVKWASSPLGERFTRHPQEDSTNRDTTAWETENAKHEPH